MSTTSPQATQLMTPDTVCSELGLSELEFLRAIARGKLRAVSINPDRDAAKRPEYRIRRPDFETFAENLRGVRLKPDFLGSSGFCQTDRNIEAKIKNAWTKIILDADPGVFVSLAVAKADRERRRLSRIKEVELAFGKTPPEMRDDLFRSDKIQGLMARTIGNTSIGSTTVQETVGSAFLRTRIRQTAKQIIIDRFGNKVTPTPLDRLYWSREEFVSIAAATLEAVSTELVVSRPRRIEGKTEDGDKYNFLAYGTFLTSFDVTVPGLKAAVDGAF